MKNAPRDRREIIEVCKNHGVGRKIQDRILRHWLMKGHRQRISAREYAELQFFGEETNESTDPEMIVEAAKAEEVVVESPTVEEVEDAEEIDSSDEETISEEKTESKDETEKEDNWPEA